MEDCCSSQNDSIIKPFILGDASASSKYIQCRFKGFVYNFIILLSSRFLTLHLPIQWAYYTISPSPSHITVSSGCEEGRHHCCCSQEVKQPLFGWRRKEDIAIEKNDSAVDEDPEKVASIVDM